jgi:hypothetical protein
MVKNVRFHIRGTHKAFRARDQNLYGSAAPRKKKTTKNNIIQHSDLL